MDKRTGGCNCGAARYEIDGPGILLVCHFTDCHRQSGSAFGEVMVIDEDNFRMTEGAPRRLGMTAASGRAKTGYFCPDCRTRLFHRNAVRPGKVPLRAGILDDTSGFAPVNHSWVASKQPWVMIPEGVETAEGQG